MIRQLLKSISRKDTLGLWLKLHSLFQLKLEVSSEGGKGAEPLTVHDLQQQLFKLDTFYMREQSAIEYAMCRLESQKKETLDNFNELLNGANTVVGEEYLDVSLKSTAGKMQENVSKIEDAKQTFESEM